MTTVNNLLSYGQPWQPNDVKYDHVTQSLYANTGNVTVEMPQNQVMTYGYGSGVTLDDFGVSKILGKGVNLANGYYTKQDLIDEGLATNSDFSVSSQLYTPGLNIADGSIFEAYVHGTVRFGIGSESKFIVVDGKFVEIEADLRAYDDNFDFESSTIPDWLNGVVLSSVGPNGALPPGAKVLISYRGDGRSVVIHPEDFCFLAGTPISMWDGTKKPIEDIRPDDIVTSYDENGNLVPGRVKRTKTNRAKHILDFHGLMVTPGHAIYCADGKFKGQHVPIIDILRSDGAIQKEDGTIIRAATNCRVGSLEDQFVWVLAGPSNGNTITVTDKAQLRLGTKALLPDGSTRSILDGLIEIYGPVDKMGFCKNGQNVLSHVFHWPFGDKLPKPEDYVLKISALTTQDIYQHGEWEQAFPPRMPAPLQGEAGGSFKQDPVLQASAPPNIPLSMQDTANQPRMSRKQRRAQEAKQRKNAKASPRTLH
ncbi:Hint domain-containing protein [Pseudovibrio sp. Ad37]|uniref:Hint domain-containing protein n=1 Tax=Pseudovibrio sp. Ad37 TaxID=989422 RepID=UPI0012905636|nr:Hint domain-containing protein [Pseudovibrio sp. Ad37]